MIYVAGIDSSTKTGVAIMTMSLDGKAPKLEASYLVEKKKVTGLMRAGQIADEVIKIIKSWPVDLAVIEGYGYGNAFTLATLVEIGTVTRYFVVQSGMNLMTCTPNALKKFTTGNGTAKKAMMMKEAHKRWGFDFEDDNMCDAGCLAVMGLAYMGAYKPPTKVMQDMVAKLAVCS